MTLKDYVNERLDESGTDTIIEGLQNNVRCTLPEAVNHIPEEDWRAEISQRTKETNGQTLVWLVGRSDPSYSIQE